MLTSRDHSITNQKQMIMDNFQWEDVKKIFNFMDWKYAKSPFPEDDYIPEIEDFKFLANELLTTVTENSSISSVSSSGRFYAKWDAGEELLSFLFVPFESEILHDESNEAIFIST